MSFDSNQGRPNFFEAIFDWRRRRYLWAFRTNRDRVEQATINLSGYVLGEVEPQEPFPFEASVSHSTNATHTQTGTYR